jgi:membrane-bound lytic murein transglycosylase D
MNIGRHYALLATSVAFVIGSTGCSTNQVKSTPKTSGNPQSAAVVSDLKSKTRVKIALAKSSPNKVGFIRAKYSSLEDSSLEKYTLDKDFDTWDRIFQGFQLAGHTQNPRVRTFIQRYGAKPEHISLLAERSSTYLHLIVTELDRRHMPTELALLPFVESAFNPDIFSTAGAAGLWQFIPETGRRYGLVQAGYYDARLDPFAATGAALDYLQKLQRDFNGDWLLALAAYNCGEGRVQKEIETNLAQGLPTDFWSLSLPRETMEYVPRLLAFKQLLSQAKHYDIQLPDVPNHARLAQLRIEKAVDLRKVALQAGLAENTLTSLNPYFRAGISMPDYSNRIILPREYAQQLIPIIQALPEAAVPRSKRGLHRRNKTIIAHKKSFENKTLIAKKASDKLQYSALFKVYNVKPSRKS